MIEKKVWWDWNCSQEIALKISMTINGFFKQQAKEPKQKQPHLYKCAYIKDGRGCTCVPGLHMWWQLEQTHDFKDSQLGRPHLKIWGYLGSHWSICATPHCHQTRSLVVHPRGCYDAKTRSHDRPWRWKSKISTAPQHHPLARTWGCR